MAYRGSGGWPGAWAAAWGGWHSPALLSSCLSLGSPRWIPTSLMRLDVAQALAPAGFFPLGVNQSPALPASHRNEMSFAKATQSPQTYPEL